MPQNRVQTLRSSVKNTRPPSGTRLAGEFYVNFADRQLGVIDVSKNPLDLVAIRFFSQDTDYAVGDMVVQGGRLYSAGTTITAAPFNVANWDLIADQSDLRSQILLIDGAGSGIDADLLDGIDSAAFLQKSGGTMTGKLLTAPAGSANAGLNLGAGTNPTTPVSGDLWTTGADLRVTLGGVSYTVTFNEGTSTFAGQKSFAKLATFPAANGTDASIRLPHGLAPATPTDGDVWTDSVGFYAQIAGVTFDFASKAYVDAAIGGGSFDYLPLTGGVLTGSLEVPAGTATTPSLTFTGLFQGGLWATDTNLFLGLGGSAGLSLGSSAIQSFKNHLFAYGNAANPGIAWGSNSNTGLWGANGVVAVSLGGVSRLTINTSGISSTLPIVLPADPTTAMQAATKQYVDAHAGSGGGASIKIADSAPATPNVGDLWFESDTGSTYVWYNDGNSQQWVQINVGYPGGGSGGGSGGIPEAPVDGKQYGRKDASWTEIVSGGGSGGGNPAGTIIWHAGSTAPTGYLKANGASLLRADYPALFAALDSGAIYGVADTLHFFIPDLRGEFVRGFDDGRGVDAGRALGSAQGEDLKPHNHTATAANDTHNHTGTAASAGAHTHTITIGGSQTGSVAQGGTAFGKATTDSSGAHTHTLTIANDTHTHTITINNSTGTETRPRNVALLACIKT